MRRETLIVAAILLALGLAAALAIWSMVDMIHTGPHLYDKVRWWAGMPIW